MNSHTLLLKNYLKTQKEQPTTIWPEPFKNNITQTVSSYKARSETLETLLMGGKRQSTVIHTEFLRDPNTD